MAICKLREMRPQQLFPSVAPAIAGSSDRGQERGLGHRGIRGKGRDMQGKAMVAQDMVVAITPMLHHQTNMCEGGVIASAGSHQLLMPCIQFSQWLMCEFSTSTSRT